VLGRNTKSAQRTVGPSNMIALPKDTKGAVAILVNTVNAVRGPISAVIKATQSMNAQAVAAKVRKSENVTSASIYWVVMAGLSRSACIQRPTPTKAGKTIPTSWTTIRASRFDAAAGVQNQIHAHTYISRLSEKASSRIDLNIQRQRLWHR